RRRAPERAPPASPSRSSFRLLVRPDPNEPVVAVQREDDRDRLARRRDVPVDLPRLHAVDDAGHLEACVRVAASPEPLELTLEGQLPARVPALAVLQPREAGHAPPQLGPLVDLAHAVLLRWSMICRPMCSAMTGGTTWDISCLVIQSIPRSAWTTRVCGMYPPFLSGLSRCAGV